MFDASVQSSLLELAQTEPPGSIAQLSDLAAWLLKKVPALRAAHAQHRRESQAVTEDHPSNVLNKKEMKTLAVTVYIAELTLDANRYRDAKMKAMKSMKLLEEKHQNDLKRHVTNVKQARDILGEVDVRLVSPATGGIDTKRCRDKDVTGLAVAVEQAMSNYERLNKVVAGEVAVLNVVALQTRGMVNTKILGAH